MMNETDAAALLKKASEREHDENDVHDVMLLCETFGLAVPAEYQAG